MPITYHQQALCALSKQELIDYFAQYGVGSGTAKAIFQNLYQKPLQDLQAIFKQHKQLDENQLSIVLHKHARQGAQDKSHKFLIHLNDREAIEAVRMPIENRQSTRVTACVSSQVGCALDCSFCMTGTLDLKRNLQAWEIVEQVLLMNQVHPENRVSNVVFMGMGEPFYNYEAVKKAIEIMTDDLGLKLARKRITVSTAGVVPRILDWAQEGKTNLAISLICALDEKRSQLMSINERYPLNDLLSSIAHYNQKTGKKVLCEYILIENVTDGSEDVAALVKAMQGLDVTLNLIPYNENNAFVFKRPSKANILAFRDKLRQAGLFATIRWSYGADVAAACGQLKVQAA
ncbi:MAG TPA: 23S rRNA (adenine(2503)-C(2))-methyltransferase RlmN [Oligoflexia bacterium]|nr:23S rRNA (adenine(2503)-C(2))-methyltransferase RlmN [Oligoflexia bacterium]HMR25388.1 23S rRNA (adenine(2503)-C(2))-methyltransferase RlmN [Oligoflexia bacterium]